MKNSPRLFLAALLFVSCQSTPTEKNSAAATTAPVTSAVAATGSTASSTTTAPAPEKFNTPAQMKKPIVLMISIDGFRFDYLEKYKPPTLLAWAKTGVRADALVPSFPTLTFPNHVTLVTGLKPGHHGIVGNRFFDENRQASYALGDLTTVNDGSWYRGIPLWTAAEKEGMLSATCYWVGSEAKIGGVDPTYFKKFDDKVSNEQRVLWVEEWLTLPEEKRPHFIGLYFSSVDSMGHHTGPDSTELKDAVLEVDQRLGHLKNFIAEKNLDVQIIVVSDHGMKNIDKVVDLSAAISPKKFKNSGRGPVVTLYANDKADVEPTYKALKKLGGPFRVYKNSQYPARWGMDDPDRRGDLIVLGGPGVYLGFQDDTGKNYPPKNIGAHGWDTENTPDMNGLFIANGSLFKKGYRIGRIDNIHVYPLVTHILDIKGDEKIDGQFGILKSSLRK